jgi:hypothetical protein
LNGLGSAELRLLNKLAIDPSLRPVRLAEELQVTRSAVSQTWSRLESTHNLRLRSNLDYGKLGMMVVFGWARSPELKGSLNKFSQWLGSSPYTSFMIKSQITSMMDTRVYFEVILPKGEPHKWFLDRLSSFRKRPYELETNYGIASQVAHHLNLGHYNGQRWEFESGFRFEASIDAAKDYADILPVVHSQQFSASSEVTLSTLAIAAALEDDYFISSSRLAQYLGRFGIEPPSQRTLRRLLTQAREAFCLPFLTLENIGLQNRAIVTLDQPVSSPISKLLHAQASTFPKTRVISGSNLTAVDLLVPGTTDWVQISQALAHIAGSSSQTCTFIAERYLPRKGLEGVLSYISSRKAIREAYESSGV